MAGQNEAATAAARPEMGPEECFAAYEAAHGHRPLTKGQVLDLLDGRGVAYERCDHAAVRTVGEAEAAHIPFERHMAKNLFLRDPKKRSYYLFTAEDLAQKLGVWPGSVTPFAALNEDTHTVRVAMDADFAAMGWIGCHPCDNTASVHLRTSDLLALLADAGVDVELLEV